MEATIYRESERQAKVDIDVGLLEALYHQYYRNVYNYICFRINNHYAAEDLASIVFEKAIRGWKRYDPVRPAEAWLISIAKNTVTDYLRSQGRSRFVVLDAIIELISPDAQPDAVTVINEDNRTLMTAMAKLKAQERQVLSLKFATDLKNGEIAKILNMSDSYVGVAAHRALKKLRKLMEDEACEALF